VTTITNVPRTGAIIVTLKQVSVLLVKNVEINATCTRIAIQPKVVIYASKFIVGTKGIVESLVEILGTASHRIPGIAVISVQIQCAGLDVVLIVKMIRIVCILVIVLIA